MARGSSGEDRPKRPRAKAGTSKKKAASGKTAKKKAAPRRKPAAESSPAKKRTGGTRRKDSGEPENKGVLETSGGTRENASCVVVGIGASAGGLESFRQFLRQFPADGNVACVLVQHLEPSHASLMPELLGKYTDMPVIQVKDGMPVSPNHVYIIPPGKTMRIDGDTLMLEEQVRRRGVSLPIDVFFRSLAKARGERAITVVLSGTGSDGAAGSVEVKACGGLTLAQEPATATYEGMPRSAVETGAIDHVLPIDRMPEAILHYARHPLVRGGRRDDTVTPAERATLGEVIRALHSKTRYDFRHYKIGTLIRRIRRRMGMRDVDQMKEYVSLLQSDQDEARLLFKDLLISVTRFFREPEAFRALSLEIEGLVREKVSGEPIRVWVAGCATGEEAYTLAMLLREECDRQDKSLDLQIFATDLDRDAIEKARLGRYARNISSDLSPERLRSFFSEEKAGFRVNKSLRETVVFAVQDLIGDPPFSNLDLVSCRNVLIYLEPETQRNLLRLFHFALQDDGLLFLGNAESPGRLSHLFRSVSGDWRIYRKEAGADAEVATIPMSRPESRPVGNVRPGHVFPQAGPAPVELMQAALLEQFAPPSVLVNPRQEICYFRGNLTPYLDFPAGAPTPDLLRHARKGLKSKLGGALREARETGVPVVVRARRVACEAGFREVEVFVHPLPGGPEEERFYLVSFVAGADGAGLGEEGDAQAAPPARDATHEALVEHLEYELAATREDLQSTIEQLETSNEELKASNEEVMSMNEELQSGNEELETSREELQSLNEELNTVNSQLEEKVLELERTNDDLRNLLTSTDIAVVFLDTDLRIRRFTEAAAGLLHLIPGDAGRPLRDMRLHADDPDLARDCRKVMEQLAPLEREVQREPDHWYHRRVLPYRASGNRIEGVVLTYADITQLKLLNLALANREKQAAAVTRLGRLALDAPELNDILDTAVREVAETLGVAFAKVLEILPGGDALRVRAGVGWREGTLGKATVSTSARSQAGYTLQTRDPVIVPDLAREKRFSAPTLLTDHGVVSGLSVIIGPLDQPFGVIGAHSAEHRTFGEDDANFLAAVSHILWAAVHRARFVAALEESEQRLRLALEAGQMGVWVWHVDTGASDWSDKMYALLGFEKGSIDPAGENFLNRVHPEDLPQHREAIERVLQGEEMLDEEFRIVLPDGQVRWLAGRGMLLHNNDGAPRTLLGVNYDVTERREAAQALQHLNETLEEQVAKRTEVLRKRTAQLRRTTIEVTKAEESVKQRVANTLHNELQQVLVSARLQLSRARNDDIPAETVARLNRIDETTKMAIDQLRTLSTELSPPILQHGTLTEVVRWAAARTEDQHGIVVDTQEVAEIEAGERELTQLVYDAVRELLLNVVKHAGSDRAEVGMRLKKGNLHLVVRDRGKGCDDEIMKALNEGRGNYGTFTITERVRMLKGRVRFTSPRGKGCKVELRVPMTESAMEAAEKASSEGLPAAVVSDDSGQTRVLVVDDHDIARRGITAMIEEREDLVVVGDAREGAETVALAQSLQPDLVLLDVNLTGMSGPATARALRQHVPDAVIIAISVDDGEAARKAMADAGAVAFVAKDVAQETLLEVIDRHR